MQNGKDKPIKHVSVFELLHTHAQQGMGMVGFRQGSPSISLRTPSRDGSLKKV